MSAVAPEREKKTVPPELAFSWNWVTWALLGVLALFVGAAFSPAVKASFVDLDDEIYVFGNPHVLGGITPGGVIWAVTARTGGVYVPATWLSLQMDATLSEMMVHEVVGIPRPEDPLPDAMVYHVTNIVWHVMATWMLFFFLYRATGKRWAAFAVALLWAVHPLRVESVAWVTERKDEIAGTFGFLAMFLYVAGRERPGRWGKLLFWLASAALVVSLCGKPMFVVMPALLVIVDWWPLMRVRNVRELVRCVVEKWPMWLVVVINGAVAAYVARGNGTLKVSVLDKAGNAILSYIRYIVLQVDFTQLAPFYPYTGLRWMEVCGALLILAVITCGSVCVRRRYPWLLAGWLWYLIAALPTIGFVQAFTQAYADRYSYLASVGLIGMVVFSLIQWRRGTAVIVGAASMLALVLTVFTFRQTQYWQNSVTLFERNKAVTSPNAVVRYSLGHGYARAGRLAEAEQEYLAVIEETPAFVDARLTLATVYFRDNQLDKALEQDKRAVELEPDYFPARRVYGSTLLMAGQYAAAVVQLEKAAKMQPDDEGVQENLRARHGPGLSDCVFLGA